MKKSIFIIAVMTFATVSFSQPAAVINGDLNVTRVTGVANSFVETKDKDQFASWSVISDSSYVSLASFGSNGGVGTLYDNKCAYVAADADKTGIINERVGGQIVFATGGYGASKEAMRISQDGQIMIEANNPTHPLQPSAYLHIGRGTSAAGHAPLKLTTTSAAILTTPEAGVIETDGTDLYWTNSSGVRKKIVLQ